MAMIRDMVARMLAWLSVVPTDDPLSVNDPFPGFIVVDSAVRADNATDPGTATGKGGAWTSIFGTWGILSNALVLEVAGRSVCKNGDTLNGTVSCDLTSANGSAGTPGIFCRGASDTRLYVALQSNIFQLISRIAGSETLLASMGTGAGNNVYANQNLKMVFTGNVVEVWNAGVSSLNYTLSGTAAANTNTGAGICTQGSGSTAFNTSYKNYRLAGPQASAYADFIVLDSATRADNASSPGSATEKGGAWTVLQGAAGINSNSIYSTAGTDTRLQLGDQPLGNGITQADVISDDWLNHTFGIILRMTDKDNHLLSVVTGPVNASLRYRSGGVLTAYATWSDALTNGVSARFVNKVNGAQFTHTVNGVQTANFTMAGAPLLQTGTKTGLQINFSSVLLNIKNFMVQ